MSYKIKNLEISGELGNTHFASLLCNLYYRRATGYLSIESSIELTICFLNGLVEYVYSNDPDLLLGKLLIENNYISKEDKQEVLNFSNEKDVKMGEALIQTGKLTSHELKHILDLQLKLKLLNGIRVSEGNFHFKYVNNIDVDTMFHINPVQVIYDAIESHIYVGSIDLSKEELNGTIHPTLNLNEVNNIAFSTSKEYKLVDMVRKPVSIKEIISNSPQGSQKTLNFIKFLKIAVLITIEQDSKTSI